MGKGKKNIRTTLQIKSHFSYWRAAQWLTFLFLKEFESVDDQSEIDSQPLWFETSSQHDDGQPLDRREERGNKWRRPMEPI